MKADKTGNEKKEIVLSGKVILKLFGEGSKSEHEAAYLETAEGSYVLRRPGGNPFHDTSLFKLEGKQVKATGVLNRYVFFVSDISELS